MPDHPTMLRHPRRKIFPDGRQTNRQTDRRHMATTCRIIFIKTRRAPNICSILVYEMARNFRHRDVRVLTASPGYHGISLSHQDDSLRNQLAVSISHQLAGCSSRPLTGCCCQSAGCCAEPSAGFSWPSAGCFTQPSPGLLRLAGPQPQQG